MSTITGFDESTAPHGAADPLPSRPNRNVLERRKYAKLKFIATDLLLVWTISLTVTFIRFSETHDHVWPHIAKHCGFLLLFSVFLVFSCDAQKLYRGMQVQTGLQEMVAIAKALALAGLILSAVIYITGSKTISRLVVCQAVLVSAIALITRRQLRRRKVSTQSADGLDCRNVLIVGAGNVGRTLEAHLSANRNLGFVVKGFLDRRHTTAVVSCRDRRVTECSAQLLGRIEDLARIVRSHFIDEVFITLPTERELVKRVAIEARRLGFDVRVIPDLFDGIPLGAPIEYVGRFPTIWLHEQPTIVPALWLKRTLDVLLSSLALVALSPVLAAVAIALWGDSSGPVFYRAPRVGKKGRFFECCKFRTMVANADQLKESLCHLNERDGIFFKISNDPRITPLGSFLRKYSLDELPQLWNVLKGDMSLVGPRPPVPGEYTRYELEHLRRLDVLPGITGLWQVRARQSSSFKDYIDLDIEYVENWSVWLDIKLLFQTISVVLAGTGS